MKSVAEKVSSPKSEVFSIITSRKSIFFILNFRLPTSDFRLPTSDFRLPTSDFRLPTSDQNSTTIENLKIQQQSGLVSSSLTKYLSLFGLTISSTSTKLFFLFVELLFVKGIMSRIWLFSFACSSFRQELLK